MSLDVLFGELRSLLDAPNLPVDIYSEYVQVSDSWPRRMFALLQRARASAPAEYREAWIPYLSQSPDRWLEPLTHVHSLKEFEEFVEVAPFARCHLHLRREEMAQAARHSAISSVTHMSLSRETQLGVSETMTLATILRRASLVWLDLSSSRMNAQSLRILAGTPGFSRLEVLNLEGNLFFDQAGLAMGMGGGMPELRHLRLGYNRLGGDGVAKLVETCPMPSLERLDLSNAFLEDEALYALAACEGLGALRDLDLDENEVSVELARALAAAPWAHHLTSIGLGQAGLTAEVLRAMFGAGTWGALEGLAMYDNGLKDEACEVLAEYAPPGLRSLEIAANALTDAGVHVLVGPKSKLRALRSLELYQMSELTRESARAIAESEHLGELEFLSLGGSDIGDEGAHALIASPRLGSLRRLLLYDIDLGSEGAARIAASPGLTKLRMLHISGNAIGVEGARALAQSPYMSDLTELCCDLEDLGGEEGVCALRTSELVSPQVRAWFGEG